MSMPPMLPLVHGLEMLVAETQAVNSGICACHRGEANCVSGTSDR
jgi:hypothetical protein